MSPSRCHAIGPWSTYFLLSLKANIPSFIHSFIHSVPLILIHWLCRLIVGFLIDLLRPRIFLVVTLTNLVYAFASANSDFLPTFRSFEYGTLTIRNNDCIVKNNLKDLQIRIIL